jgi:alkyldihydroxyacetonephosphate synthase
MSARYSLFMDTHIHALREKFGPAQVLTEPEQLAAFGQDALRPHRGFAAMTSLRQQPLAIVQPTSTDDVVQLVTFARECRLPLVPYGGGSGLMGGALSVRPGIVVDMKRMDRILHVDHQAMTVRVQSGMRLRPLGDQLAQQGLLLGHDPWSISIATVGGAIGTHGLGYLGGRYGSIGAQVLGLEVVLGTGEVIRTHPLRKRSTGPDLTRLFIGAEGTLGIVTEATLQIFPQPQQRSLVGFTFPDFSTGFHAVLAMQQQGVLPASMDLAADSWHVDLQERRGFPPPQPPQLRLVFDGLTGEVAAHCAEATTVAQHFGGSAILQDELQEYWENRHAIADRWARDPDLREGRWLETPYGKSQFDFLHLAIPPSKLLKFREQAFGHMQEHDVCLCEEGVWIWPECYALVLYCRQTQENNAASLMRDTTDAIYRLAQSLGGSIEYVHGIGIRLGHLMEQELGSSIHVLRTLKAAFDPDGIVNPGKLGFAS